MINMKYGTNRFCIVGKKFTYKFAWHFRGFLSNINEYENYLKNKDIVAYTEFQWWGLKQESLSQTISYKRYTTKEELEEEHKFLYPFKLHNKIQIGIDKDNKWKFFDYEDIKFYLRKETEL